MTEIIFASVIGQCFNAYYVLSITKRGYRSGSVIKHIVPLRVLCTSKVGHLLIVVCATAHCVVARHRIM